jgi:hypothetical protein
MTDRAKNATVRVSPPSKHELAAMIWLCVFPTLTAINLTFSGWLRPMSPVLRTFVLATIVVPIVIYGLMPLLGRVRVRLFSAIACARDGRGVGSTNADPCGASLRGQDEKHPRHGSEGHPPRPAQVTLEKTRAATPSGVQRAVREGSL